MEFSKVGVTNILIYKNLVTKEKILCNMLDDRESFREFLKMMSKGEAELIKRKDYTLEDLHNYLTYKYKDPLEFYKGLDDGRTYAELPRIDLPIQDFELILLTLKNKMNNS